MIATNRRRVSWRGTLLCRSIGHHHRHMLRDVGTFAASSSLAMPGNLGSSRCDASAQGSCTICWRGLARGVAGRQSLGPANGAAELAAELGLGNLHSHPGTCCTMLLLQQVAFVMKSLESQILYGRWLANISWAAFML